MIASIAVIYTTFKMTYSERIKEFGMLSSIGMSKKQRKLLLNKEIITLGLVGITTGLLIGLGLSNILIKILNNLIRNTQDLLYSILAIDPNTRLYMKIPILVVLLTIFVVYVIIFISNNIAMKKINKMNYIDAIRNAGNIKITPKNVKTPRIIEKLFKEEGIIAYKNIRRDKSKYKTIVISLSISIILFLTISEILSTFYFNKSYLGGTGQYNDYRIYIEEQDLEIVTRYLTENKLINKYFAMNDTVTEYKELTEDIMSEDLRQMLQKGAFEEDKNNLGQEGKLDFAILKYFFYRGSL